MDLCFPQLDPKERQRIVCDFYRHLADLIIEALWFGGCHDKARLHRQHMVEMLNPRTINDVAKEGRSVIILSSHMCNWELSGGILNYNYTDCSIPFSEQNYVVVYRALKDKKWDAFIRRNRTAPLDDPEGFEGCLESRQVLRYALSHRHEQKFYNFITDQRPYRAAKGTVPITFLGQPNHSMAAAAHLAQRFGFAVVYQSMRCTSRGHYTLEYIPITSDASQTTAQEIMDRYYELLSADVQAQPEQYLWSHNRFG